MTCADLEVLICDYVDGTLSTAAKADVDQHLSTCTACAEMARDSAAAVSFIGRAEDVEPPAELLNRILFHAPGRNEATGGKRWFQALLTPFLAPRFAMGMAMTILWLAMMARFVVPVRQLTPSDLSPTVIWAGMEDRGYRAWARTLKFYDNLKVVYQIQTTLRDWQQQQDEEERARRDDHKLPVQTPEAAGEKQ
jgi:hypothetical protein